MTEQQRPRDKMALVHALMEASQAAPHEAALHAGIAALLSDLGQFGNAVGAGLMAVGLAPDSGQAQAELGRALFLDGQIHAALEPCARSVTLVPGNLGALVTFSAVLFTLGLLDEALEVASEAVTIDPGHFQARANLSLALDALGRLDEAEAQSRRALALDPTSAHARHNLAGLRLSRGKYDRESWTLYDARLDLTPQARAVGAVPRWAGEPIEGQTILLHAEQGFGDVIQFARYVAMVKARGARVVLAVPQTLLRLLAGLEGVDEVVPAGRLPRFDVFCPLASLPGVFRTDLATIPRTTPYLRASPEAVAGFRPRRDGLLHVGLAWAGNPGFLHDRFRSIQPDVIAALGGVEGVRFHCLQKDAVPPFPMENRMDRVQDFLDTADLVAELDLVITVDTAIAHLAGALHKPVWMLSRFMGCWRWLRDRADSPWYPTMRIFRQPRPGRWDVVLDEVAAALAAEVEGRGQRLDCWNEARMDLPSGPARVSQASITGSAA